MQVNHRYVQNLTPEKVDRLIDAARAQQADAASQTVASMRGTPPQMETTEE
jgi:hypothetical protein